MAEDCRALARALIAVEGLHASARARLAHAPTLENRMDAADDLRHAARILGDAGEPEHAARVREAADRIHPRPPPARGPNR